MPREQLLEDLLAQIDKQLDDTKKSRTILERSYNEEVVLTYYQGTVDALLKARFLITESFRDNGATREEEE